MLVTVGSQKFIHFLLVMYDILVMCWDRDAAFAHELSVFFESSTFLQDCPNTMETCCLFKQQSQLNLWILEEWILHGSGPDCSLSVLSSAWQQDGK